MAGKMNWTRVRYENQFVRYRDQETINVYDPRYLPSDGTDYSERVRRQMERDWPPKPTNKQKHKKQQNQQKPKQIAYLSKKQKQEFRDNISKTIENAKYIIINQVNPESINNIIANIFHFSTYTVSFSTEGMTDFNLSEINLFLFQSGKQCYGIVSKDSAKPQVKQHEINITISGILLLNLPKKWLDGFEIVSEHSDKVTTTILYKRASTIANHSIAHKPATEHIKSTAVSKIKEVQTPQTAQKQPRNFLHPVKSKIYSMALVFNVSKEQIEIISDAARKQPRVVLDGYFKYDRAIALPIRFNRFTVYSSDICLETTLTPQQISFSKQGDSYHYRLNLTGLRSSSATGFVKRGYNQKVCTGKDRAGKFTISVFVKEGKG